MLAVFSDSSAYSLCCEEFNPILSRVYHEYTGNQRRGADGEVISRFDILAIPLAQGSVLGPGSCDLRMFRL